MKKMIIILLLGLVWPASSKAQSPEVTQLILNLEKLNELRKILKELKKGYEILFEGYTKIRDISRGNFKLHQAFLDGLLQVSPSVKRYGRIADIVKIQLAILSESRQSLSRLAASGAFSAQELDYLQKVYGDLLADSVKNLDALTDVLTDKKLRASDDERLSVIDGIYEQLSEKLVFLRDFNSNNSVLAAQRREEKSSMGTLKEIYGLQP
ncbi:TerB family tellurite resistance protein [Dyadobacter pollutisoli]|uniref:TerB family tellurite resistance protein n=1 Tax=Dyadobacter pollutisoli TaxID=2910158 RepID=A0A9E8NAX0_9BACT|nr:TerB family tellurite resistance protein [Dyadobacter pollutisoli]WAC13255.1 TerB family tellurite resistance protein [Dyadobacter pollutisoli]